MEYRIVSARYMFDECVAWKVYGEKLQSVVQASLRTDLEPYAGTDMFVTVNTLEDLVNIAKAVEKDLHFPHREGDAIWIKDDYME